MNKAKFMGFKKTFLQKIQNSEKPEAKMLLDVLNIDPELFEKTLLKKYPKLLNSKEIIETTFKNNDWDDLKTIKENIEKKNVKDNVDCAKNDDYNDGPFKTYLDEWHGQKNDSEEYKTLIDDLNLNWKAKIMSTQNEIAENIKKLPKINIAIDGPGGAGKSSISKVISNLIEYFFISTGQIYRAMAWLINKNKIDDKNEEAVINFFAINPDIKIIISKENKVFVDSKDITSQIIINEVATTASNISKYKIIRKKAVDLSREVAKEKGVIMDGRDVGSVILPEAELKIYLTATPESRARRRFLQNKEKNVVESFEQVLENLKKRDFEDKNRKNDPLKQEPGAEYIDSTDLNETEVILKILKSIAEKAQHAH